MVQLIPKFFTRCVLIFVFSLICSSFAWSKDYFFPKEEGGKWGIYMHYQEMDKKGYNHNKEKWVFKPKWDMVWFDTSRCAFTGNGCDGFITFKNGKYGYAWSNGNSLENEFEAVNIYKGVAKKNGKWGGFKEHQQVLPFAYDSLLLNPFIKNNWSVDTSYLGFAGLQHGKWSVEVVKMSGSSKVGVENLLQMQVDGYVYFEDGAAVKTNGKWYFIDLRERTKPVFSAAYDSIKRTGSHYAVLLQEKWFLLTERRPVSIAAKGWDNIEATSIWNYLQVWENGMAGVLYYEKNSFKEIIGPRALSIKIRTASNGRDVSVIELTESGQKVTYDRDGRLLSSSGDATVMSTKSIGPFRINYHGNGVSSVLDAATSVELIRKTEMDVEYFNDPEWGHTLNLKKPTYSGSRNYYYGLYRYATKSYLEPKYKSEFKSLGAKHLFSTVNGGRATDDIVVWEKRTLQQLALPFVAKGYKNEFQAMLSDEFGLWYELVDGKFIHVPKSKVIKFRTTVVAGIEIEYAEDYSKTLKSINGKPMNEPIEKADWIDDRRNIYSITLQGKRFEYFEYEGKARVCNYILPAGKMQIAFLLPRVPWPGTSVPVPIIITDSAQKLLVINAVDNRRMVLSITTVGKDIVFEGSVYTFKGFESFSSIYFASTYKDKCNECRDGYTTKKEVTNIKGQTSYETKEIVEYKEGSERVWDVATRSYKYVKTIKPVTRYETIEKKQADRTIESDVKVKCSLCAGTAKRTYNRGVVWDGKAFKKTKL